MKNKLLMGLAILAMGFSVTAGAQAPPPPAQQAPPADESQPDQQQSQGAQPSAARVSLMHGDVNTQRGDSGEAVAAALNAPIVAGDRVSTGTRSRLELTLDFANFLRLDERTEAKIGELSRTKIQVQVARGIVEYSVFKGNEADIEIDTPNASIRPLQPGRYRVQITADDECDFIVREGEAEVSTPQGSTRIHKGQMVTVRGTDNPEYKTSDATRNDTWDDWNKERDHEVQNAESWNHANRYYTGVNDLDSYGHWTYIPGYGDVWVPAQSADWAPYRDGRWSWEPYWGWTWVSYEPWGWAPYHYGRWFSYGGSWCWWPGPVYAGYRPFWSPAYVSFFGFSGRNWGAGFGLGFGSFGWLPIGPGDCFYPWWGGFRGGFAAVNIFEFNSFRGGRRFEPLWRGRGEGFSNFRGIDRDDRLRRGITTMRGEEFGRGGVRRDFQRVGAQDFRDGRAIAGGAPVVPTRDSLRFSERTGNSGAFSNRGGQERFFSRSGNGTANGRGGSPESFQSGQAQMRGAVGRNGMNGNAGGQAGGQVNGRVDNGQSRGSVSGRGDVRVGQQSAGSSGQTQDRGGWQRFDRNGGGSQQGQSQGASAQGRYQGQTQAGGGQGRDSGQSRNLDRGRNDAQPSGRGNGQPNSSQPQQQGGFQRFSPSSGQRPQFENTPRGAGSGSPYDRGAGRYDSSRGNSGRQELNLQRPIMTPRNSGSQGGSQGGYYGGSRNSSPQGGNYGGSRSSGPPPSYSRGGSYGGGNPGGGSYSSPRSYGPSGGSYAGPRGGSSGGGNPGGGSYSGPRGSSSSGSSGGGSRGSGGGSSRSSGSSGSHGRPR